MKRCKVLRYLPTWPDVEADHYRVALRRKPQLTPFVAGSVPKLDIHDVEYRMVKCTFKLRIGWVWEINIDQSHPDIEILENDAVGEPIAFRRMDNGTT